MPGRRIPRDRWAMEGTRGKIMHSFVDPFCILLTLGNALQPSRIRAPRSNRKSKKLVAHGASDSVAPAAAVAVTKFRSSQGRSCVSSVQVNHFKSL